MCKYAKTHRNNNARTHHTTALNLHACHEHCKGRNEQATGDEYTDYRKRNVEAAFEKGNEDKESAGEAYEHRRNAVQQCEEASGFTCDDLKGVLAVLC